MPIFGYNALPELIFVGILNCGTASAMKKIIRKFPNAKLIIGGTGPEKEKSEKLTEELNLKKNVVFMWYIENMVLSKYYASSDIFVLPSINLNGLTEALGVVLLEAMARGTPAIGTTVGGVPDIIKDGYNGFLVEQKSSEQIAERVLELLNNEELRERFSNNVLETMGEINADCVIITVAYDAF
jgi:glycosyltransferase involved in cell wall biosynthesis